MALPQVATVERWGDVRFAELGKATEGRAVQANDPRLKSTPLNGVKLYPLATAPTSDIGLEGDFAFAADDKSFWIKGPAAWEFQGKLFSGVTESTATVITPLGATGTIQIST
jgi:hypothetical protein